MISLAENNNQTNDDRTGVAASVAVSSKLNEPSTSGLTFETEEVDEESGSDNEESGEEEEQEEEELEVSADCEEEDEEVEGEEEQKLASAQISQPSLTPTPETPIQESRPQTAISAAAVDELDETRAGPAIESVEDLSKSVVRQASCQDEYDPEREYFSDPDFHDERPVAKVAGESESGSSDEEEEDEASDCMNIDRLKSSSSEHDTQVASGADSDTEASIEDLKSEENEVDPAEVDAIEGREKSDAESSNASRDKVEDTGGSSGCEPESADEVESDEGSNRSEASDWIASEIGEPETEETAEEEKSATESGEREESVKQEVELDEEDNDSVATQIQLNEEQEVAASPIVQSPLSERPENSRVLDSIQGEISEFTQIAEGQEVSSSSSQARVDLFESECLSAVTASEAQAEWFADESTLNEPDLASFPAENSLAISKEEYCRGGDNETNSDEVEDDEDDTLNASSLVQNLDSISEAVEPIDKETDERESIKDQVERVQINSQDSNPNPDLRVEDHELESEVRVTEHKRQLVSSADSRRALMEQLVVDYCDKLVELIKEEAFKQIELIVSNSSENLNQVGQFKLSHLIESKSLSRTKESLPLEEESNSKQEPEMISTSCKKIYTSSLYFDDQRGSFPTIEQQVDLSREIVRQLKADDVLKPQEVYGEQNQEVAVTNQVDESPSESRTQNERSQKRASAMFRRRRARMSQYTLGSNSIEEEEDDEEEVCVDLDKRQGQLREPANNLHTSHRRRLRRRASLEPSMLRLHLQHHESSPNSREASVDRVDRLAGDGDEAAMTDTEYEAPKVRLRPLPARATRVLYRKSAQNHHPQTSIEITRTHAQVEESILPTASNSSNMSFELDGEQSIISDELLLKPPSPLTPPINLSPAQHSTSSSTSTTIAATGHLLAPKFKPFLDHNTMKDLETLRATSPNEYNEHSSVSPEICLKLVQDLKQFESKQEGEGQSLRRASAASRGAQMFERRQMQSSDWVVGGGSTTDTTQSSEDFRESETLRMRHKLDLESLEGSSNQQAVEGFKQNQSLQNQHAKKDEENYDSNSNKLQMVARRSLTEEAAILTTDESSELLVELPPVAMSYAKSPQLELATISKTPSFSASSRRVIECDSPDLLTMTSLDEEIEETSLVGDQSNVGAAVGEVVQGEPGAVAATEVAAPEVIKDMEDDDDLTLEGSFAASMARVRPTSRSSELHRSQLELNEWQLPQVTQPTWRFVGGNDEDQIERSSRESLPPVDRCHPATAPISESRRSRCASVAVDGSDEHLGRAKGYDTNIMAANAQAASTWLTLSRVSAMRDSYQNLVDYHKQLNSSSNFYQRSSWRPSVSSLREDSSDFNLSGQVRARRLSIDLQDDDDDERVRPPPVKPRCSSLVRWSRDEYEQLKSSNAEFSQQQQLEGLNGSLPIDGHSAGSDQNGRVRGSRHAHFGGSGGGVNTAANTEDTSNLTHSGQAGDRNNFVNGRRRISASSSTSSWSSWSSSMTRRLEFGESSENVAGNHLASSNKMDSKLATFDLENLSRALESSATSRGVASGLAAEVPTRSQQRVAYGGGVGGVGGYNTIHSGDDTYKQLDGQRYKQEQQHAQLADRCCCCCHLERENYQQFGGRQTSSLAATITPSPMGSRTRPPSEQVMPPPPPPGPPVRRDSLNWEMRRRLPRNQPLASLQRHEQQVAAAAASNGRWSSIETSAGYEANRRPPAEVNPRHWQDGDRNLASGWASASVAAAASMRSERHSSRRSLVSSGRLASLPADLQRDPTGGTRQYYNLRVALRLANQQHKVIIERRPPVTYARLVDGQLQ